MNTPRALRNRLRTTAIVTLSEHACPAGLSGFTGVLWEVDRHTLVLRNASAMLTAGPDTGTMPADGEVVILLTNVAFIQMATP